MPVIALYEFIKMYLACILLMEIILCRSFATVINTTLIALQIFMLICTNMAVGQISRNLIAQ